MDTFDRAFLATLIICTLIIMFAMDYEQDKEIKELKQQIAQLECFIDG